MKKTIRKRIEELNSGDLICVEWCDASTGKSSLNGGSIDVPVRSWGVFIGLIGTRIKHIVLAQNSFKFTDDMYDLDYTAIPADWALEIQVIEEKHLPKDVVDDLIRSFVSTKNRNSTGGLRSPRMFQHRMHRLSTYGRPD